AIEAYRESLKHRPDAVHTHRDLATALAAAGKVEEAVAEWKQVRRLDPKDPSVEEAIKSLRQSPVNDKIGSKSQPWRSAATRFTKHLLRLKDRSVELTVAV